MKKEKVIVLMSGGVDSSVAAHLLIEKGYEVIGATMFVEGYFDQQVKKDAAKVASDLNIDHHILDFTKNFEKTVIDYFINEYLSGRTPNPCVVCNPNIKWQKFINFADELDAKYIATGHYAKVDFDKGSNRYRLKNADSQKDQSYFLSGLKQEHLSRTIFPLAEMEKPDVRKIASRIGIEVAEKPDSQEICFISEPSYTEFLQKKAEDKLTQIGEGDYIFNGKKVGRHKGFPFYTIGQRKGLGIALGVPVFVKIIDAETNEITLAEKTELSQNIVNADNLNFVSIEKLETGDKVYGKIRFGNQPEPAVVESISGDNITVKFEKEMHAVTPGQTLVLYDKDGYLLLSGIII